MSEQRYGILIVDDEFSVRDALYNWFRKDGFRVATAENASAALAEFQERNWDVVLVDIQMPGMNGLELQKRLLQVAPDTVVIMITAQGTMEAAVQALKLGAFDYLMKPVDPDDLGRVISKALEHRRLTSENSRLRNRLASFTESEELVGHSPEMQRVLSVIESLASTDATVLIRGESGTGKELVARTIHVRSGRQKAPLVAVNCSALPETLFETELFGHERGAFTGAQQRRKGKLEQADGGTLFLDEIGAISPRTQLELLRVLDTQEFTRVGGSRPLRGNFRVICATNQDLEKMVVEKAFREDLYFRISAFRIDLPPLRARRGDIPLLARQFLRRFAAKMDKDFTDLSREAVELLEQHKWSGNVRELSNAIERAVVIGEPPLLKPEHLPISTAGSTPPPPQEPATLEDDSLAAAEKAHIARIIERSGWNISQAARILDVDRVTLYNKLKKYGLKKE